MESSGHARWFERLLAELRIELWIRDAAEIRTKRVRKQKELARSYLTIVKDLSRVMNRLKALYRSWAIPCAGHLLHTTS